MEESVYELFLPRTIVPSDHGCHTPQPDFDLVNDTPWRQFETYKRPTSKEPNELKITSLGDRKRFRFRLTCPAGTKNTNKINTKTNYT